MKYIDQIGQTLEISKNPKRIISLVPSQTELIVDLGFQDALVGITKFCVYPKHLRKTVTVVGGTKQVHLDRIQQLSPDIIIANKEENTQAIVNECSKIAPVWVSDIGNLKAAFSMIISLGEILGNANRAQEIVSQIISHQQAFRSEISIQQSLEVAYVIWKNPYMVAGNDTFIHAMLEENGFKNSCQQQRYPEVTIQRLQEADLILLSSEPFPFKKEDVIALQKELKNPVLLVDGEFFSWYGTRLLGAFAYFSKLQIAVKKLLK